MDDSLYDEFGNYLGPDLEEEDDDLELEEEEQDHGFDDDMEEDEPATAEESTMMQMDGTKNTIKRYREP